MSEPSACQDSMCQRRLDRVVEQAQYFRRESERLWAALDLCMVGGNHLANHLIGHLGGDFAMRYPPSTNEQDAQHQLGSQYDCWTCWAAIMRARSVLQQTPALTEK